MIIILSIVALTAIVIFYYLMNKKIEKNYATKNAETQELYIPETINIDNIDIFKILKFQSDFLAKQASHNNNTVLIQYDENLPRIYDGRIIHFINAVVLTAQFFLHRFKNITLKIEFSILEKGNSRLIAKIGSTKFIFSQKAYNDTKDFIQNGNGIANAHLSSAKIELNSISSYMDLYRDDVREYIGFSTILNHFDNPRNFKKYSLNIQIAENNEIIYQNLKMLLSNAGGDVTPNNTWQNAKNHIDDLLYSPDLIIISTNILNNEIISYLNSIKRKNIYFAFIVHNQTSRHILNRINFNYFTINLPYVYDDIYALCSLVNRAKRDDKFLEL